MTYAKRVKYPYLLVLAEKDKIVDNKRAREWHARTGTPAGNKVIKLVAGAYHEISKEPNNGVMIESVLTFMESRLSDAKAFG